MKSVTLGKKISRVMLIFAVFCFVITASVTGWWKWCELKKGYGEAMQARTKIASSLLGGIIHHHDYFVKSVVDLAANKPICEIFSALQADVNFKIHNDTFYVLDSHGRVICISAPYEEFKGLDFSAIVPPGKAPAGNAFHHQSLLTTKPVISTSYPLPGGDTLVVEHSYDNFFKVMAHFEEGKIYDREIFFLLSATGQVVYHPDPELVKSRANFGFDMQDRTRPDTFGLFSFRYHGKKFLACSREFAVPAGWTLYYAVPTRDLLSIVKGEVIDSCGLLLVQFILLFTGLHLILNRFFANPMRKIVTALHDSGQENSLHLATELGVGIEEFNSVIAAFNIRDQALRDSEQRYRDIFDSSGDSISIHNLQGLFLRVNKEMCQNLGYSRAELLKMSLADIDSPETFKSVPARLSHLREQGIVQFEAEHIAKDGSVRPVEVKAKLVEFEGQTAILSIMRDISERQKAAAEKELLEMKLRGAKKMEAIGAMAGGVAHDLNNILSGIINYPELLLMQLDDDNPMRRPLEAIKQSGLRAAAVVSDLLTVARGVVSQKITANLNSLVNDYYNSPEHEKLMEIHQEVQCRTKLAPDLWNISCSPVHVKKCLMNLVGNAAEAIKDHGIIKVVTENRHIERRSATEPVPAAGEYVVIAVSDSGSGIAEKDLEHIFDPFYSKKKMGRSGTGLGLAVVWNTMEDHGGAVTVTSSERGTTFRLFFPATSRQADETETVIDLRELRGNGEDILVVDDHDQQRDISARILKTLGYRVRSVESGEKAIEYVRQKHVDLVLLDMIMEPGLDGLATYEGILQIRPRMKAVIASGFSESDDVKKCLELGAGAFVRKPYLSHELGQAVQQELKKQ